jgi:hypothetical protein
MYIWSIEGEPKVTKCLHIRTLHAHISILNEDI